MPDPIRKLSVAQFAHLLAAPLSRAITDVHLHHTWRPRRQDFRGLATIEAMRRYHVETHGWGDIAQHLTIDPAGGLWTGRNWNWRPASASGANGSNEAGPFMIEMVGDFDEGADPFDGPQRESAVAVVAHLLRRFSLNTTAVKFHREIGAATTCPGAGVQRDAFLEDVARVLKSLPKRQDETTSRAPFSAEHRAGFLVTRVVPAVNEPDYAEVPENEAAGHEIDRLSRAAAAARQSARRGEPAMFSRDGAPNPEWNVLKPHAVNLSRGELSEAGEFSTSPEDVDGIIDAIRAYAAATADPRVVLYAHGGLIKESDALAHAKTVLPWWLGHGVFPVFFIWESGLLEILRQYVIGPRDLADYTSDPAIEIMAKIPGTIAWNGMKESARRASSDDAGGGYAGGALHFARKLAALVAAGQVARLTVHAVGHSAGAIFHAHLVPRLVDLGVTIDSMAMLAPAARVDLFKDKLMPLVGSGIARMSCFTMEEDAERQDDCFGVYHKSLLYLVSRAFEGAAVRKPIVGLEESIRKDTELKALFGLEGGGARAELHLSYAPGRDPNPLTQALRHGDFDNDPKTMSAVLRRILGAEDQSEIGEDDFPFQLTPRTLDDLPLRPGALAPAWPDSPPPAVDVLPAGEARGRALCIGIDDYRERPLTGCVRDARAWGTVLTQLGFSVTYLLNGDATRDAIVREFRKLIASAAPGGTAVLHFSGHGTQVPDHGSDESDRYDEAFVPADYHRGRLLLDDDIADMLSRLDPDAAIALFMDCCHSGTNSRFAPLVRARAAADERVRYLPMSEAVVHAHRQYRRTSGTRHAAQAEDALPGVVHFAACLDNEYAWETAGEGDFSAVATRLLASAVANGETNEAFIQAIRRGLAAKGRQHPQLMRLADNLTGLPLLSARAVDKA